MIRSRNWGSTAIFVVLLLVMTIPGWAQITSQTGAVRVVVSDPSGETIGEAEVTLASAVGTTVNKQTTGDGSVVFPLVDPGEYKLTVEKAGFRRALVNNVAVRVTEVANLTIAMELGEVTVEITVSADAVETVETTNATRGGVLTGDVLRNLPLSTRNFADLLDLNAGTSAPLQDPTRAGHGAPVVFVAGQRGTNNNLVINGTDANNLGNNNLGNVPIPSPDSLEEFRVQTSLYDASQGKTSGGNINVLTRGGTNSFHGEAFDYLRNDAFKANSFFFNKGGIPRPVLKQNQFGGNFGGPIPKLHDTFFFGSYQGTRQSNGVAGGISTTLPVLPASRDQASIETAFGLAPGSLDPGALELFN